MTEAAVKFSHVGYREQLTGKSLLSLFSDGDSDSLLSWERDKSLLSSADDEDVARGLKG